MTARDAEITRREDAIVARLEGDIDLSNTPMLSTQLLQAVTNDTLGLIVDLSGVRYIDSVGIRMFFTLVGTLHASRQGLALALEDGSPIRTLIKITNLDEAAALRPTVEECLDALRSGGLAIY